MATSKVEIVSSEMIKPSTPTPSHLKTYTMCLQDQLALPFYTTVLLFYSASDVNGLSSSSASSVMEKLKASLSETLSSYYPFSGRFRENAFFECNDQGALFVEARAAISLSEVLADPDIQVLEQFRPIPLGKRISEEELTLGVKVSIFECGGVGICVCLSHKIADGSSLAQFLVAWSQAALGLGEDMRTKPRLDASALFPPKDNVNFPTPTLGSAAEKVVTRRFCFSGKGLAKLRAAITEEAEGGLKPTRVEAVTALIWRAAVEATTKARRLGGFSGTTFPHSAATHSIDIRSRAAPPLPDQTVGNLYQSVVTSSAVDVGQESSIRLDDLVAALRKSFTSVNGEFVSELQGNNGSAIFNQPFIEANQLASRGHQVCKFTSWTRFPLYKVDFGWGKPAWVCTTNPSVKNFIILMGTGSEDELGIEAWVTLTEADMIEFQANKELLQFVTNQ